MSTATRIKSIPNVKLLLRDEAPLDTGDAVSALLLVDPGGADTATNNILLTSKLNGYHGNSTSFTLVDAPLDYVTTAVLTKGPSFENNIVVRAAKLEKIVVTGSLDDGGSEVVTFNTMVYDPDTEVWSCTTAGSLGTCSYADGEWTLLDTTTGSSWVSLSDVTSPEEVPLHGENQWVAQGDATGEPVMTSLGPFSVVVTERLGAGDAGPATAVTFPALSVADAGTGMIWDDTEGEYRKIAVASCHYAAGAWTLTDLVTGAIWVATVPAMEAVTPDLVPSGVYNAGTNPHAWVPTSPATGQPTAVLGTTPYTLLVSEALGYDGTPFTFSTTHFNHVGTNSWANVEIGFEATCAYTVNKWILTDTTTGAIYHATVPLIEAPTPLAVPTDAYNADTNPHAWVPQGLATGTPLVESDGIYFTEMTVTGTLTDGTPTTPETEVVFQDPLVYSGGDYTSADSSCIYDTDKWILTDDVTGASWEATIAPEDAPTPGEVPLGAWADPANLEGWKPVGAATGTPIVINGVARGLTVTGTLGSDNVEPHTVTFNPLIWDSTKPVATWANATATLTRDYAGTTWTLTNLTTTAAWAAVTEVTPDLVPVEGDEMWVGVFNTGHGTVPNGTPVCAKAYPTAARVKAVMDANAGIAAIVTTTCPDSAGVGKVAPVAIAHLASGVSPTQPNYLGQTCIVGNATVYTAVDMDPITWVQTGGAPA